MEDVPQYSYNNKFFHLKEDFHYKDIVIPAGFKWDGASIPRPLRNYLGSKFQPEYIFPSLIHDYIYASKVKSRKWADRELYNLLRHYSVPRTKAKLMYVSVRLFGWFAWSFLSGKQIVSCH